jgi:hypothetical protein
VLSDTLRTFSVAFGIECVKLSNGLILQPVVLRF